MPVEVYRNQMTTPCPCPGSSCCSTRKLPLDSIIKATCCAIGIIGEVYTGFNGGKFVYIGNAQHATMFSMFLLSGVFEILNFYRILRLPPASDYLATFLAITTEGILFVFHLHGRTPADIYVHTILIYAVLLTIAVGTYEAVNLRSHIAGLLRSILIILQGTWFWHVGAILYPPVSWLPVWDELAVESIPRAANVFCQHVLLVFACVLLTATVMGYGLRNPPARLKGDQPDSCISSDQQRLLDSDEISDDEETELLEMRTWKPLK